MEKNSDGTFFLKPVIYSGLTVDPSLPTVLGKRLTIDSLIDYLIPANRLITVTFEKLV